MQIDASDLDGKSSYNLITDSIVPRPVAWVSSVSPEGVPNLAPFSFFTGVTARPPMLVFSVAARVLRHEDRPNEVVDKVTLANIKATGDFVVHVARSEHVDQVNATSVHRDPAVDEIARAGFTSVPGTWCGAPRVLELPIAMECRLEQIVEFGDPASAMVFGRVLGWHIDDSVLDDEGRVRLAELHPLGRLGVDGYHYF